MKEKLEKFFRPKNTEGNKAVPKKTGYIIVLGLIGIMIIILSNLFSASVEDEEMNIANQLEPENEQEVPVTSSEGNAVSSDIDELEGSFEEDLVAMLNKIQGVSEAEVMVTLDSTNRKVYEKNLIKGQQTTNESDQNGGTRQVEDSTEETQVVFVRQGDQEVPLLIQTKQPEVRGVFVVAKGADHASVKSWIVEAVSRVLDVPTHRISVMPKN